MTFLVPLWLLSFALQVGLAAFFWKRGLGVKTGKAMPTGQRPPGPLPRLALFIPCSGLGANTEKALRSLIDQDYPDFQVFLCTNGREDPARQLALELEKDHAHVSHVEADAAQGCSQKNGNLLAGLDRAGADVGIYAFCDANHEAPPSFLKELVEPLAAGRCRFSAGYRRSRLFDCAPGSIAFHSINRLLLLLQSVPFLTQPWGGAMAADAMAFHELGVKELWARAVVDDSSLAGLLAAKKEPVVFCPGALVTSAARQVQKCALRAWWLRQLQYPKYYTRGPWLGIGALLFCFGATALASLGLALFPPALQGFMETLIRALACAHLLSLLLFQELLRQKIAAACPRLAWLKGLCLAASATYAEYGRSIFTRHIVWKNRRYLLDRQGLVLAVLPVGENETHKVW